MPTRPSPTGGDLTALVVDDEPVLAGTVATYLERAGLSVTVTGDGAQAVELARQLRPDVVILDLGLPTMDGTEVCRQVRTFSDCYIVMLTARADEVDRIVGLSIGADDYVTKPFSPRELVARVQAMLRRPRGGAPTDRALRFGDLTIHLESREVSVGGQPVDLTRTEFDVLAALATHPRRAFSRRALVTEVWGGNWVGDDHLVDVHVGHVRRKIGDDPAAPRYVLTVRGVGYRMGDGS